ncbi:MAG: 4-hydroxy-tetrahydrodipicolinate reductase [Candidatus Omnitrophica bacterium]|nr:4-hydroxy-tetrahydrodipicolinate reductase [Candidatus Omnitrophota bacterium]
MVKIGISGFCGRMGQRIFALARKDKDLQVVFGLEKSSHPDIGKSKEGVVITDDLAIIEKCDSLVEFTNPQATVEHIPYLVKFKKPAVIGTTGLTSEDEEKIKEASKEIPILFSPNMSVGVNLLFELVRKAAKVLRDYQVQIQEAHHIHKKDAPSGTAKKVAQIINEQGFNIKTEEIKAIREDEIVGEHRIIFESALDKIELFHSAKTRDIFAQGALLGAKWIVDKKPGLYSMREVLGL